MLVLNAHDAFLATSCEEVTTEVSRVVPYNQMYLDDKRPYRHTEIKRVCSEGSMLVQATGLRR